MHIAIVRLKLDITCGCTPTNDTQTRLVVHQDAQRDGRDDIRIESVE